MNALHRLAKHLLNLSVFVLTGDGPAARARMRPASARRTVAYAFAVPLPMAVWAFGGYVVASSIFQLAEVGSWVIAGVSACLVLSIERILIATGPGLSMNVARVTLAVVMASLGATLLDTIVFSREITQVLRQQMVQKESARFDALIATAVARQQDARERWLAAEGSAAAELDGTGGSRRRVTELKNAPIYMEKRAHADRLRTDYERQERDVTDLERQREAALGRVLTTDVAIREAGLLARIVALQEFLVQNAAAKLIWAAFFFLMMFIETLVLLVKVAFGESIEERLARQAAELDEHSANLMVKAMLADHAQARKMIAGLYAPAMR